MRREFIVILENQDHPITLEADTEGCWHVGMNGRTHQVDARLVRPGTWSLLIAGRSYVVDLDERKRGTTLLIGGIASQIAVEDARRKRLAESVVQTGAHHRRGEVICAPIAGKVVKLLVNLGDKVETGQSVGVIEAMKMENEIKSERGGQVESVHVSAGQSVDSGDKLVTLS